MIFVLQYITNISFNVHSCGYNRFEDTKCVPCTANIIHFKALEKGDINNGKNKNNDNTNNNNVVAQSRIDLSKRYLFHGPMDSWKADQCFLLAMMYFVCINLNVLLQER